jgi:hypothetical protein
MDVSGYANHGTWNGTGDHSAVSERGRVMQFNGTDDNLLLTGFTVTRPYSFWAWVYPRAVPCRIWDAQTGRVILQVDASNYLQYYGVASAWSTQSALLVPTNAWSLIGVQFAVGQPQEIWVDRQKTTDGNVSGNIGAAFRVGSHHLGTASYANLQLGGMRFYDRWLADSEANHIYQSTRVEPYGDIRLRPRRVVKAPVAPGGLSIPIAMHHYKQLMGAA